MNDEAVNLLLVLLVHTHQDGTATPRTQPLPLSSRHWRCDDPLPPNGQWFSSTEGPAWLSHRVPERELEANMTQTLFHHHPVLHSANAQGGRPDDDGRT
jgi:hypothetical protein